jgi:hypothetical protein
MSLSQKLEKEINNGEFDISKLLKLCETYKDFCEVMIIHVSNRMYNKKNLIEDPNFEDEFNEHIIYLKLLEKGIYPYGWQSFEKDKQVAYVTFFCQEDMGKKLLPHLLLDSRIYMCYRKRQHYVDNFPNETFLATKMQELDLKPGMDEENKKIISNNSWNRSDFMDSSLIKNSSMYDELYKKLTYGTMFLKHNQKLLELYSNTNIEICCNSFEKKESAVKILLEHIEKLEKKECI